MALGGYLSARTARQILDQRIATERYEIEHEPDEERAELRVVLLVSIEASGSAWVSSSQFEEPNTCISARVTTQREMP